MALFIFKYCLPVLLGYTLFLGIAGRFNPLRKPFYREERPSWMLGIWTGISVSVALGVGLHMAYSMTPQSAKLLLPTSSWLLAALLCPGLVVYMYYRRTIANGALTASPGSFDWSVYSDNQDFNELNKHGKLDTAQDSEAMEPKDQDMTNEPELDTTLAAAFLDYADLDIVDTNDLPGAINDTTLPDIEDFDQPLFGTLEFQELIQDTHKSVESLSDDPVLDTHNSAEPQTGDLVLDTHKQPAPIESQNQTHSKTAWHDHPDNSLNESVVSQTLICEKPTFTDECGPYESFDDQTQCLDQTIFESVETLQLNEPDSSDDAYGHESIDSRFQSLHMKLEDETALREETEKHLRITRKALSVLEAESRNHHSLKADSIIGLEEKLAHSIDKQIESETRATLEKDQRIAAETNVVTLKQNLVKTKHEIRRSAAARAKALSTANKSIAFARQTLQIRANLESELEEAKATLKNRQTTISSLIRALEKEKRRTQDDITSMAKQLVLHEKQLRARRSLEEVARSVETKLNSRLVKKVAKARPLISDH